MRTNTLWSKTLHTYKLILWSLYQASFFAPVSHDTKLCWMPRNIHNAHHSHSTVTRVSHRQTRKRQVRQNSLGQVRWHLYLDRWDRTNPVILGDKLWLFPVHQDNINVHQIIHMLVLLTHHLQQLGSWRRSVRDAPGTGERKTAWTVSDYHLSVLSTISSSWTGERKIAWTLSELLTKRLNTQPTPNVTYSLFKEGAWEN